MLAIQRMRRKKKTEGMGKREGEDGLSSEFACQEGGARDSCLESWRERREAEIRERGD